MPRRASGGVSVDEGLERHRLDTFALTVGLLAIALAVLALASRSGVEVDGLVVLATVWVVLGLVGLSRALYRLLSPEGADRQPSG